MLNLGAGELLVIALIALIVLGPEKIPGAMRQLGRFMGELRRMSSGFQDELRNALNEDEDLDNRSGRPLKPPIEPASTAPSAATDANAIREPGSASQEDSVPGSAGEPAAPESGG